MSQLIILKGMKFQISRDFTSHLFIAFAPLLSLGGLILVSGDDIKETEDVVYFFFL